MKFLLFCLLVFGASTALAQTAVIRLKSHNGAAIDLPKSLDRFGGPPIEIPHIDPNLNISDSKLLRFNMNQYDTIEMISSSCLIQKGTDGISSVRINDTLCDDAFDGEYDFIKEYYQDIYGDSIVFIGFEKKQSSIHYENNPYFNKRSRNGSSKWIFIFLALCGFGAYMFQPSRS